MIVFTNNINIISAIAANNNKKQAIEVFNISSAYSGYIDCTPLITRMRQVTDIPKEFIEKIGFDLVYLKHLLDDPIMFSAFMPIMMHSFNGGISIILVGEDPYRDSLTEVLIKIIQQRYGYQCWKITSIEDVDVIRETLFRPYGLIVFDEDITRFENFLK